jgi:hypothetical protein
VAVVATAQVGNGTPTERQLRATNHLVLRLKDWSWWNGPWKDDGHMWLFRGLIEGNAKRQILFEVIRKEGVMTFSSDFARRLWWAHRCALVSGMHFVTERLTNRSSKFWALAAGNAS